MNRRALFAAVCSLPAMFVKPAPRPTTSSFTIHFDEQKMKALLAGGMREVDEKLEKLRKDLKLLRG
jgi:hypothetical protein